MAETTVEGASFGIVIQSFRRSVERMNEWVYILVAHGRIDQQNSTELFQSDEQQDYQQSVG